MSHGEMYRITSGDHFALLPILTQKFRAGLFKDLRSRLYLGTLSYIEMHVAPTIDTYPADIVEWVARLAADAAVLVVLLQQMRVVGAQLGLAVVRSDEGHVQAVHDGALQVSWNRVTRWN